MKHSNESALILPRRTHAERQWRAAATLAALAALLTGCGGGSSSSSSSGTAGVTETPPAAIDPTRLPVGDAYFTSAGPRVGYAYLCSTAGRGNGFGQQGPWFNPDGSWDSTKKVAVQGSVSWFSQFVATIVNGARQITGNGLPSHHTGEFPVAASSEAYRYDKNPNSIQARTIAWNLPANPQIAATPSCLPAGGAIGIMLSGAALYNAADADIRDGMAWELQDACQGHPQGAGEYHYHNVSSCLAPDVPGTHSPLVGYIADGFGIYGNQGEGGVAMTNAGLDECHGHSHELSVGGQRLTQYHYHASKEFPYAVGCYKGAPVSLR